MTDEHEGQAEPGLEVEQEVEDLAAQCDVERAGGFVGDHQPRVEREGAGDGDALALAAAEGVGVAAAGIGGQADAGQQLLHAGAQPRAGHDAVHAQGFADGLLHRHAGVEGGERVLEHHAHLAVDPAQAGAAEPDQVDHLAIAGEVADGAAIGLQHADEAVAERGLARAAFADDAEVLALVQVERDALERGLGRFRAAEHAGLAGIGEAQVAHGHEHAGLGRDGGGRGRRGHAELARGV